MSTPIYHDADADRAIVQAKRLAFIGYGNQGAAQAQNLRDSGVSEMLIGNREDRYKEAALAACRRERRAVRPVAWRLGASLTTQAGTTERSGAASKIRPGMV